nr:transcriptional control protein [uncultured bacterium]
MALTEIDRNLLKRCLSKEPGAWKDFVDRFIGLFVHVIHHTAHARSVRVSPHDVDDLCAEVFLALLADDFAILRRFRGKSSLATYLTVLSRRIVVREMSHRRLVETGGQNGGAGVDSPELRTPEAQRIEDREEVQRLLEDLADTDAEVVRQFHLEGRTYREISTQLGIPENTIGPTLSRARDRMRRRQMQS